MINFDDLENELETLFNQDTTQDKIKYKIERNNFNALEATLVLVLCERGTVMSDDENSIPDKFLCYTFSPFGIKFEFVDKNAKIGKYITTNLTPSDVLDNLSEIEMLQGDRDIFDNALAFYERNRFTNRNNPPLTLT